MRWLLLVLAAALAVGCAPNLAATVREVARDNNAVCLTLTTVHRTVSMPSFALTHMVIVITASRSGLPSGRVVCHPDGGMTMEAGS